jgi:ABC-type sugar transport system ATPase subunit
VRTPGDAIEHGIALVPEDRKRHGIFATLSVWENVVLSALRRFSRKGILDVRREKQRAQEFVSSLRIATSDLDKRVRDLSGGNQQKVVIAKWLNTNAEVFLFDEPTRGIDVGGKIEVYRLMGRADLPRRRHRDDFIGAARDSRPERSHFGDARRKNLR